MTAPAIQFIPAALRARPQWVLWHYEERGGKATKVPYSARNGRRASSTDKSTWATFEEALASSHDGNWDGVGFVFAPDDPFAGVDLDKCCNPITGEVKTWAREIVDALNSYTEVSPSGTGLKVFLKGNLPPGGRKRGDLEMYDRDRYFTVTGQHLEGTPLTIEERSQELAALHARIFGQPEPSRTDVTAKTGSAVDLSDDEILEKARTAKDGAKFKALMGGDWSGYPSQSEADSALCCRLAFWYDRDEARIDRLFRQSGLYRPKWDERHFGDGRTYGQATIESALELTTETYTARPPSGNDASPGGREDAAAIVPVLVRLSRVAREEVRWLWPDRLPLGRLTGIIGDPGVGKSWLTLAIAAAVTKGVPLPGAPTAVDPGKVLLLTAEDGLADTVRPRLEDMEADLERIKVLAAVRDHENERLPSLLTDIPALEQELSTGGYQLVVIDPINAYLGVTLDTHRDAPLRAVLAPLAALAERQGVATMFVLHLTKAQADRAIYRAQGGIAYIAATRVVHLVGVNPDNERERVFACIKNNLAPLPPALAFSLNEGQFGWKGLTDVTPAALLAADDEDVASGALAEAEDFLRQALADGPRGAKAMLDEGASVGIARRTLMRAKAAMKISSQMIGEEGKRGAGKWWWRLPGPGSEHDVKDARP